MESRVAVEIQRRLRANCIKQYRILWLVTLSAIGLPPLFLVAGWLLTLGPWSVVPQLGFVSMDDYLLLHSKLPRGPNDLLVWAGLYLLMMVVSVTIRFSQGRVSKAVRPVKRVKPGYLIGLISGVVILLVLRGAELFHIDGAEWLNLFKELGLITFFTVFGALVLMVIVKIIGWALGPVADAVLCVFGGVDRLLVDDSVENSCSMLRILTRRAGFLTLVLGLLTLSKAVGAVILFVYQSLQILIINAA